MADPRRDRRGRLTIRLAQLLLVAAAVGLWAASRLPWVVVQSFDGLGPSKTATMSGAVWSSALLPLAVLLLATAAAALAVR
ncbi:MAG: Trp biosynthesis-associated membrane protein, partial [Mycobacterium sp.]